MALINLILSKYSEYFLEEDYKHLGSFHLQTHQQRTTFSQTGNSAKHPTSGAGRRPLTTSLRTKTNNSQQRKDDECSELSSLSSTYSFSSSSSSSTSSFTSSSTADSISSSSSDSSCEVSDQSLKQLFDTVYDGSLGLYLSEKSEESVGDNWTLKPEQKLYLFNSVFGLQRFNVRESLKSFLTINLTDDLKEELQPEMRYFNDETDCEYTEKLVDSVLHSPSPNPKPNVVYERQRFYLHLGEEIGETSTDDFGDEDKICPVFESVELFESLTIGRKVINTSLSRCFNL